MNPSITRLLSGAGLLALPGQLLAQPIDPGQVYTLEFGLSKALSPALDVGVIGYWQPQTTDDSGLLATSTERDRKLGLGAEVSGLCPTLGMFTSLRDAYEFDAADRPEGHLVTLTLTKRF